MKLKITVTVELEVEPEWYPDGSTPPQIWALEKKALLGDPNTLMEIISSTPYTVSVIDPGLV